jgi:ribonuclease HII
MARQPKKLSDFDTVIGIDEAGRGPIAGPVAVGAVKMPYHLFLSTDTLIHTLPLGVDSKKMSPAVREFWFKKMHQAKRRGELEYTVRFASHQIVDTEGIVAAIHASLAECLGALDCNPERTLVLLDGSLVAPPHYEYQDTIIGGDEIEPIIALASVAAKVSRDRKMVSLAKKYPDYGFDRHKGYGTRAHYQAINQFGLSPIHRRTFILG